MPRAWASLLALACRWGGPEGSPTALIDVDEDVPSEPAAAASSETDDAIVASDDATSVTDVFEEVAAPADAGLPPPPLQEPQSCAGPAGLLCDPVGGSGCLPLMQCVADPNSSTAAGLCVFGAIPLDAACAQDTLSTSCPPQHTCVAGQCREYCYCDTDCDDGAACVDPSGPGGSAAFKLCAFTPR